MATGDPEQAVCFLEGGAGRAEQPPPLPPLWRAALASSGALVIACGGAGALLRHGGGGRGAAGDVAGGAMDLDLTSTCKRHKTCHDCASSSICRWCPEDYGCHDLGSLFDPCSEPIHDKTQCWGERGETCPHHRVDATGEWIEQAMSHQADTLQDFPTYSEGTTGLFDLASGRALASAREGDAAPGGFRIALLADWGSGTCAARSVAALVAADDPHMSVHLGGVHRAATEDEYKMSFAGEASDDGKEGISFPKGEITTFAMAGNHEAISGFSGLYKTGFGYTGQAATYAVWQSDAWRVVALDTGRKSYSTTIDGFRDVEGGETDAPMPDDVVDWLTNVVKLGDESDKRGVILLSHHQPYDAFGKSHLGAAKQLNQILPKGKEVVWFFGHKRVLAIYKKMQLEDLDFVIHPRLIGIGGFPSVMKTPLRSEGLVAYDSRTYQTVPDDDGASQTITFNGYALAKITGGEVEVSYITGDCNEGDCTRGLSDTESTVVARETFTLDPSTGSLGLETSYIGSELTHIGEQVVDAASVACIPEAELGTGTPALQHYG